MSKMVSIFCPWRKRQKKQLSRGTSSDESVRPHSLPPAFEPITYTPLDDASEEQQMLDAIFSTTNLGTYNEGNQGTTTVDPPPGPENVVTRVNSRRGLVRLESFGGKLRTRFSREGRVPVQDPAPEERQPKCDGGHLSLENKMLFDVLDSGNSSEAAYDSDAHNLLTPQITTRLKTSPGSRSTMFATFDTTPIRDTREQSNEPFCHGLDGTPVGKEESDETEMNDFQQTGKADGTVPAMDSLASQPDVFAHVVDSGPTTPLRTHISRASCANADDDCRKTPILTPSEPGTLEQADEEISPLTLAGSTESIEIHVTKPPGDMLDQDVSYDTSPCPQDLQARRYIGTSVYSSPASDNPELESNLERIYAAKPPVHQVKRSLTSKSVPPENVRKSRVPANQPQRSPSTAQRDSSSFVRRSRFIEDLDDVFTLRCEGRIPPKDDSEKENAGRRCSDGWLSGGKRVGYGYNFTPGERYPRLSCSEGSADEKYKAAITLQSFKNRAPMDYRLPIQDLKREGFPSGDSNSICPDLPDDNSRTHQPKKVGNAFASLAKKVRRHRRNDSSSTAVSGRSTHSRELEQFPRLELDPDIDLPIGFDPARRDVDSGTYIRNPAIIQALNALREPSSMASESSDMCPMMGDDVNSYSEVDEITEDVEPGPMSAEVWSKLYDDCVQTH
ncbi:uncharacterized protein GIQ15_01387 [Arthroderma uncinatum]|uniref:uncharacterized protein n=1 Tax=Arthroderma uncinatum TaxID=74035 RepID=UPI00144A818E|nr:uncharacterized protein GIQ15_01387 [Arthroderma uncinatum]KAF3491870.1 hypothetical protein GIQ15_01387 [Arthroderma uncinatum]